MLTSPVRKEAQALGSVGMGDFLVSDPVAQLLDSLDDGGPRGDMHSVMKELPPSAFHWALCGYTLHNKDGTAWATVACSPRPVLSVQMERCPPTTGGTFRWHKNCVIPKMRVRAENLASVGEGAAVLLSAVTVDVLTNTAHSIGLEGMCLRPLVNGECTFSSLSFTTTSYNLPGRPSVYLMASLLFRSKGEAEVDAAASIEDSSGGLRLACSAVSPALTVDARKRQSKPKAATATAVSFQASLTAAGSGGGGGGGGGGGASRPASEAMPSSAAPSAHDALLQGMEAAVRSAVLPFAPDLLEVKLQKVGKDSAAPLPIDNSIEGLRAYLSALNIRNKCKHPLFFVLRFDKCIGLLYDASLVRNPAEDDGAFYQMMEEVGGGGAHAEAAARATGSPPGGRPFAPFVLAVKAEHDETACERPECPVRLSSGLSLPHVSSLPTSYTMLCDRQVAALRKTYCRLHCTHGSAPHRALTAMPPATPHCATCRTPHGLPPPPSNPALAEVQKGATALLATVGQMATACSARSDAENCPETEWQVGLRILAEAMALHCRTRSADEIVGFMTDEMSSSGKRHAPSFIEGQGAVHAALEGAVDHSHAHPTTSCDMVQMANADDMMFDHSH